MSIFGGYVDRDEDAAYNEYARREGEARHEAAMREPHEYVGGSVDVSVGEIWEPCNFCGADRDERVHRVEAAA